MIFSRWHALVRPTSYLVNWFYLKWLY